MLSVPLWHTLRKLSVGSNPWRGEEYLLPELASSFVSEVSSKGILFLESHIEAFGN